MNRRTFPLSSRRAILWSVILCCLLWCIEPRTALAGLSHRHPLLIGYFGQWGVYDHPRYLVRNLVTNGSIDALDQINYAQGSVAGGHCSVADPNADLNLAFGAQDSVSGRADDPQAPVNGNFHQLAELKRQYPRIRLVISLEGKASDFAQDALPPNRAAFVRSCIDTFIRGRFAPGRTLPGLFEGFDIDWEYPQPQDYDNFTALIREFRAQLRAVRPGLWLEVAAGPGLRHTESILSVVRYVNAVGVMNYDYNGPWDKTTGLVAPLFPLPGDPDPSNTVSNTIATYRQLGVPARKLILGVPFYGYSWHDVTQAGDEHGLFSNGIAVHGDHPYREIATLLTDTSTYRDPRSSEPWFYNGSTFWTYDDPLSIRRKMAYARHQKLGGAMAWELSEDTSDAELLKAARAGLSASPSRIVKELQASASPSDGQSTAGAGNAAQ
jgi:chitinase